MNYIREVAFKTNNNYNMIIEIPKGTKNKNELIAPTYDTLSKGNKVKYKYPYNYGLIPGTLGIKDNEPVDVILWDKAYKELSVVNVQIVGIIKTTDEKGYDPKIICVPINKKINTKQRIKYIDKTLKFLNKFKKLKKIEIDETLYTPTEAIEEIEAARKNYIRKSATSTGSRRVK